MKKKKVTTPTEVNAFIPYTENVDTQLNAGGVAAKYAGVWPLGEVAIATGYKTNVPVVINDAFQAMQIAQQKNQIKDDLLHEVVLFNKRKGREMQDATGFDAADMEQMGYFTASTPPDENTAKPVITGTTVLPDMIIIDWFRGPWKGVVIYASYDGVNFVKLDKDGRSPFEDTRANQSAQPEVRHYKLRYLNSLEKEIGVFSDAVKVVADIHP